jgi:hypothetical protein
MVTVALLQQTIPAKGADGSAPEGTPLPRSHKIRLKGQPAA